MTEKSSLSNTHVLMIGGPEGVSDDLKGTMGKMTCQTVFSDTETFMSELTGERFDLVLVELTTLGEKETQTLASVRSVARDIPLIVLSDVLDPEHMRQLFKFNITDWIAKPVAADTLETTIRTCVRSTKTSRNRVHAVISAVGGAGATTAAISMADLAHRHFLKEKKSVALFDLDFSTGNCGYALDELNGFNIASVTDTPRRIDSEFIRAIQKVHERGFCLYSFKQPDLNTELNSYELVLRMLDAVLQEHDHSFLDVPYYETEWRDDVLAAVNSCMVVVEPNLPAMKHAIDLVERIKKMRDEPFSLCVLVNKRKSSIFSPRLSKKRIEGLFDEVPIYYLPEEGDILGEALDRGIVPATIRKRNAYTKSLTKFMKDMKLFEEVKP